MAASTSTTVASDERTRVREQQIKQAEELLFSGPQRLGVAKGLFWGKFVADWVLPYPQLSAGERPRSRTTRLCASV